MTAEKLLILNKSVIARHNEGYYVPCVTKLKLNSDEEGVIYMEGFLEFLKEEQYNCRSYFFIKQPEGFLEEVGPDLRDCMDDNDKSNNHYTNYLHDQDPTASDVVYQEGKKFLLTDSGRKEFHLLNSLETENKFNNIYEYYV